MKIFLLIIWILLSILSILSCNRQAKNQEPPDINLIPMYGGIEKSPQQKEADEEFIQTIVSQDASRKEGAKNVAKLGWKFLKQGDHKNAMRRFNQVWLLDPNNPESYWGFAAIYNGTEQYDEAISMAEMAFEIDNNNCRLICDLAFTYGNKANSIKINSDEKNKYFQKAISIYNKGLAINSKEPCLYHHWAITLFQKGNYAESWEKVIKSEELGFKFSQKFLQDLEKMMARPKSN
jgi:tetratricopeptide (TPR) repeat protein